MKIGIITFHYAMNYGAVLQAYGLVDYIKRQSGPGTDVEVIDFRSAIARRFILRALGRSRWNPRLMACDCHKYLLFRRFLHRHLNRSPRVYHTASEMNDLSDHYDLIVAGSDQVWNTKTFGFETPYFMQFANPGHTRLASYAPSCGMTTDWGEHAEQAEQLLQRFHHMSARDSGTVDLVERTIGRRPVEVLDPTFLGNFASVIDDRPASKEPYLLVYHVQRSQLVDKTVALIKKRLGLRAITIGDMCETADETHVAIAPERWLGYVRNASFVVTNSFHGTIFSLLYRRPFWVVPHPTGAMRLVDLLTRAGASERMIDAETELESFEDNVWTPDFDAIQKNLSGPLEKSKQFLNGVLADARNAMDSGSQPDMIRTISS